VAVWSLYLIRTRQNTLYAGIATDVARRLEEHLGEGGRGSKYLRSRGPLELVYQAPVGDRSLATRAEARLKRLPKGGKEAIVEASPDGAGLLRLLFPEEGPQEDRHSRNKAGRRSSGRVA
jgi:putative endonuclease